MSEELFASAFSADEATPAPAPTPEPAPDPAAETPPADQGQPRGPDGKFAPKPAEPAKPEAAPEAKPDPAPAAAEPKPAEPAVPPGFVPVAALQEARAKLKAMEEKAAQPPPAPPTPPPDRYDDPEGYEAYQQARTQALVLSNKLDLSEDMAVTAHGQEKVDAAKEWAKAQYGENPAYWQDLFRQRNPYAKLLADYDRDQALKDVSIDALKAFKGVDAGEFAQFQAWKAAQAQAQAQPAPAAPAAPETPTPPRSIIHGPAAGGLKPGETPVMTHEEAFASAFKR